MEMFNNITKQQSTPTQQPAVEAKPTPKQEVKVQLEKVINEERKQAPEKAESEIDVTSLLETLNQALDPFDTSIRFGFDNSSEVFYVSIIDTNTNDTIRRFPVEQAESLVAKMHEIVGIIFDEKG